MKLRLALQSKLSRAREWFNLAIVGRVGSEPTLQARLPKPHVDPAWEKTIEIAFERSSAVPQADIEWNNALDTKAVQVFSVGAILLGVTQLRLVDPQWAWQKWTFLLAVIAFLLAALNCYRAYRPGGLAVGLDPKTTVDPELLERSPTEYQRQAIVDLARDHDLNTRRLQTKAEQIRVALFFAAAEVVLLVLSLLRFKVT